MRRDETTETETDEASPWVARLDVRSTQPFVVRDRTTGEKMAECYDPEDAKLIASVPLLRDVVRRLIDGWRYDGRLRASGLIDEAETAMRAAGMTPPEEPDDG